MRQTQEKYIILIGIILTFIFISWIVDVGGRRLGPFSFFVQKISVDEDDVGHGPKLKYITRINHHILKRHFVPHIIIFVGKVHVVLVFSLSIHISFNNK